MSNKVAVHEVYREEMEDLTRSLCIKLNDGFQIPIKFHNTRIGQTFLRKTPHGFYQSSYMILANYELYVYDHKDDKQH